MPDVATYDPKKVTVTMNGRIITGFAPDGVVTIAHNEDIVTPTKGAQGDTVYSENANESGTATLPLLSTSSSLPYLRDLAARRKAINFGVTDANDYDPIKVNEENCRITKVPDAPRNKEETTVSVAVYIPDLHYR